MRRQNDETLQAWAAAIAGRMRRERKGQANLIFHGAPGAGPSSSGHADDEDNRHLLDFEDVTTEDLERLREFLLQEGVGHVVVKEHSPVLGTAIVAEGRAEGEEGV